MIEIKSNELARLFVAV